MVGGTDLRSISNQELHALCAQRRQLPPFMSMQVEREHQLRKPYLFLAALASLLLLIAGGLGWAELFREPTTGWKEVLPILAGLLSAFSLYIGRRGVRLDARSHVRQHPRVVFRLYVDADVWRARKSDLPAEWAIRLSHSFVLPQVSEDAEFEPIARRAFREMSAEAEYNFGHEPIRITEGMRA